MGTYSDPHSRIGSDIGSNKKRMTPARTRISAPLATALAVALLVGCGDGGGPTIAPDVVGFYSVTIDFEYVSTDIPPTTIEFSCSGTIEITEQSENGEIAGTFTLEGGGDCRGNPQEGIFSGTINTDGTFVISNLFVGNFGLTLDGACELFELSTEVTGEIRGDQLTAEVTQRIECPASSGGLIKFDVTWQMSGARQESS